MRRLTIEVRAGRLSQVFEGRMRWWRAGESLAMCCARLAVVELELPGDGTWGGPLVDLVAGVAMAPLPRAVCGVRIGEMRLDLESEVGAAAWRFVVSSLRSRAQLHAVTRTGTPTGRPPVRTTASASAKDTTVPSVCRT